MSQIYDGEEIRFGNGYPSLIKFFQGNPEKSLVVFFPGWAHLGRISYGFPGCNEDQYLANSITNKGYPYLATSYPIDHPVYDRTYPEFSLTNWGNTTAEITKQVISDNQLSNKVIPIFWSAAGQIMRHFNVACESLEIEVQFSLGLESSPASIIPSDQIVGMKKTNKHLISLRDSHYVLFWKEIEEQNKLNGKELISKEKYFSEFLGDIPVGIMGTNECFEKGEFVINVEKSFDDKNFFAYNEYPMIATISGNSQLAAPYHPFVDKGTWGLLITRKIYHEFIANNLEIISKLPKGRFKKLVNYVNTIPDRLHKSTQGNHFMFLGKLGAKKIAHYVEYYDKEFKSIKNDIQSFLG